MVKLVIAEIAHILARGHQQDLVSIPGQFLPGVVAVTHGYQPLGQTAQPGPQMLGIVGNHCHSRQAVPVQASSIKDALDQEQWAPIPDHRFQTPHSDLVVAKPAVIAGVDSIVMQTGSIWLILLVSHHLATGVPHGHSDTDSGLDPHTAVAAGVKPAIAQMLLNIHGQWLLMATGQKFWPVAVQIV